MSQPSTDTHDNAARNYQVLAFLCVMAAIAYVQRSVVSVPAKDIATSLQFDPAREMSWVLSAWYLGYAIFQIPSGWFADQWGSRRALAYFVALWSLAMIVAATATGLYSLLIFWGLMGAAQAGAFPCATKAIGQIFPESQRARATGFLAAGMAIGGALGPLLTGYGLKYALPLAERWQWFAWRIPMLAFAILGLIWTLFFLLVITREKLPARVIQTQKPLPVDWSRMIGSGSLWLLSAQQFFRAAGMVFFLTTFPTFLRETRGVSAEQSGILTSFAGVGVLFGSLTGGFYSDWLLARTGNPRLSRQGVAVVGMSLCSLLIVASYFVADVRTSMALIALGAFSASFGGISGYTVAISFGGRHVATVFSTMNMFGNFGAALFPLAAGELVKATGNWNLLLFFFAGIMAVDAICWALLNPQGTLMGDDDEPR